MTTEIVVRVVDDRRESARALVRRLADDGTLCVTDDSFHEGPWRPPGSGLADVVVVELHTLLRRPVGYFGGLGAPRGLPRLLALVPTVDLEVQRTCLAAGALGCLRVDSAATELVAAVKRLYRGEPLLDASLLLDRLRHPGDWSSGESPVGVLTPRELEVLRLLAAGQNPDRVAALLTVSPLTVRAHLKSARAKLGAGSTLEAVLIAIRARLIDPFV